MATVKNPIKQDTLFLQQEPEAKPEQKPDYTKWSVYKKLARAKVMLQKSGLKKSGYNPYDKFYYFDLGDFLPRVNEIFDELGLIGVFNIVSKTVDGIVEETANLQIFNIDKTDEFLSYTSPTAEAAQRNPIQGLGSKHTYMRRYLYMEALDIAETDMVDAGAGTHMEEKKAEQAAAKQPTENSLKDKPISKKQKEMLVQAYQLHAEMVKESLAATGKSKFDELTMYEASKILQEVNAKTMEEAKKNA